jgi:hypothetical protein
MPTPKARRLYDTGPSTLAHGLLDLPARGRSTHRLPCRSCRGAAVRRRDSHAGSVAGRRSCRRCPPKSDPSCRRILGGRGSPSSARRTSFLRCSAMRFELTAATLAISSRSSARCERAPFARRCSGWSSSSPSSWHGDTVGVRSGDRDRLERHVDARRPPRPLPHSLNSNAAAWPPPKRRSGSFWGPERGSGMTKCPRRRAYLQLVRREELAHAVGGPRFAAGRGYA